MSIANKLSYLNETREQIREGLNKLGGQISPNDTFRSYADKIEEIYDSMPKVEESDVESGTLEGTIKGGLDINLKGNTSQYTTTGKNKLNTTLATTTLNGITCTRNDDGTYTLNGTATAGTSFTLTSPNPTLSARTYKLVGVKNGSYSTFSLRAYNSASSLLYVDIGSGVTFTTNESLAFQIFIDIANGTTLYNVIVKPMITTDTSLTYDDYEPYTNGASPNPDYPQPINVVSGDNEVVVCGKNLFNKNAITSNSLLNSSTGEAEYNGNNNVFTTEYISVIKDITYSSNFVGVVRRCLYDKNKNFVSSIASSEQFTPNIDGYIRQSYNSADKEGIQIVVGNTLPQTIEPYQSQTYPIYLGVENLFDLSSFTPITNATSISLSDEILTITNTTNGYGIISNQKVLKPNTQYIASCKSTWNITKDINNWGWRLHNVTKNTYGTVAKSDELTFTTTSDNDTYELLYYIGAPNNNAGTVVLKDIQLEEGTKSNHPSTTPIELCKIGDYQDYFTKNSGKNLFNNANALIFSSNRYVASASDYSTKGGIEVEPNTSYIISLTSGSITDGKVYYWDSSNTAISNVGLNNNAFTTPSNCKYVSFYASSGVAFTGTEYAMLEKGTQATPYEPYGIGQWCKYNAVRHLSLPIADMDNSEDYPGWKNVPYIGEDYPNEDGSLSNKSKTNVGINCNFNTRYLNRILYTIKSSWGGLTETQIKSTYPNLAFELYYGLNTPYLSLIESETLISQLDNIQNAMSYEDTTNIGQVNNDLPFKLDLKAILDWRNNGGE